jgi:hypothetical protein
MHRAVVLSCIATLLVGCGLTSRRPALPNIQQAMDSSVDVWGEAALRQPGGPSYEFF